MPNHRMVVVDDHDLVRVGLQTTLEARGIQVVGSASTGRDGLRLIESLLPDLALVDIRMPDISGIELCERVREQRLPVKLAVLTSYVDRDVLHACLLAGVEGYLLKDAPNEDLLQSIEQILAGKSVLNPTVTSYAMRWLRGKHAKEAEDDEKALDLRDIEILRWMAKGYSNPEIAKKLYLSENTIKVLINNLYRHFSVKGRVEAVMEAHRRGLL